MSVQENSTVNKAMYERFYQNRQAFLRCPGDWIPRFHNMYLREYLPQGTVLDYGCGSANNSIFFIRNGYDVYGVDVVDAAMDLIRANLESYGLGDEHLAKFQIVPLDWRRLPFEDKSFDLIISNQVLYYLNSDREIKRVCKELSRCLRPGGTVFFTMMGPRNYYIVYHARQIRDGKVYQIRIDDPSHRLHGLHEEIYLVRDEDELKSLFDEFDCVTTGHFEQKMFDMSSNFHWIFVGRKPGK